MDDAGAYLHQLFEGRSGAHLRLNPVAEVEGQRYLLAIQEMSALRVKSLGAKVVSLEAQRDEIAGAIDFLITSV